MKLKGIMNSLTAFKWHSVFIKYMICIFLALSIVLGTIFWTVTSSINTRIASREEKDAEIAASKLSNIIESTENHISINIFHLTDNLYRPFYELEDIKSPQYITAAISLKNKLNEFKLTQSAISSIYVYAPRSHYVVATDSSDINSGPFDAFIKKDIFSDYIKSNKEYSVCTVTSVSQLCMIYPIVLGRENIAYVSYNIDLDYLSSISLFDISVADEESIIYTNRNDSRSNIVENIALPFFSGKLRLLFSTDSFTPGIPKHYYVIFIVSLLLFSIVVAYVISCFLYYNINTIYLMLYNTFDTGYGDYEENTHLKQNEYSFILNNLNNLIKKNSTITGTLNENLIKLNNTKIHALSLQISPHFLFNTLNLISMLSMEASEESKKKIPRVVDLLSQVLSISLTASKPLCTLNEEISYTKIYIDIQKYKYEDFNVVWSISDEFLKFGITKFSLQPIIENAIHHGFSISEERIITIDCSETDKVYRLTISNPGMIQQNRVDEINEHINRPETPKTSIGLWNTNQRIKLLFGDEYGLKFFSRNNFTGTIITLPKTTPDENTGFQQIN